MARAEKRKKVFAENTDVVIINYDGIEIVEKEIKSGGFDLIVVDEANYVKTVTTRRWKYEPCSNTSNMVMAYDRNTRCSITR
jgi:SNF2 family DNA or RNA helicase